MSIHSEVSDNSPAKKFIEDLCLNRWEKMKSPCKGCKYRCPVKDSVSCCVFATIPKDWAFHEGRELE